MIRHTLSTISMSFLLLGFGMHAAHGQSYSVSALYTPTGEYVSVEAPLLQASDGNFYGAESSSSEEDIYRLAPSGEASVLYTFQDVIRISGMIQGVDGAIYGVSSGGGVNGYGSIFRITLSGVYTQLYSFSSDITSDQTFPNSLITDASGNLYITTYDSDYVQEGLFQFNPKTLKLTDLHNFSDQFQPNVPVTQATNGKIYGSGQYYYFEQFNPSIYSVDSTGTYSLIFESSMSGPAYNFITPIIEGPDTYLYGIAQTPFGDETGSVTTQSFIYKINLNGTAGGEVAALPSNASSSALTFASDGRLYGEMSIYNSSTDTSSSEFYSISPDGGQIQTLASIPTQQYTSYGFPFTLLQGADGAFYSVTGSSVLRLGAPAGVAPLLAPPIQISLSPSTVQPGKSSTLKWKAAAAFSKTGQLCVASGNWSGIQSYEGSIPVSIDAAGDYKYVLSCDGNQTASATLIVTSSQSASATSLIASPQTGTVGSSVYFSGTVNPKSGQGPAPTGTVSFSVSGHVFATLPVANSAAQELVATGDFPAGPSSITALYGGDSNYLASSSNVQKITLTGTPAISFQAPTSVGENQPLTIKVTVSPVNGGPVPTGTVTINLPNDGSVSLNLVNGSATYNGLASGSYYGDYYVSATYDGDSNYATSSGSFTLDILPQAAVALNVSPTQAISGQSVSAVVNVTATGDGSAPTGSVRFYAGGEFVGSAAVSNGYASLTASTAGTPSGTYPVTASYSGDSTNGAATSAPVNVTITSH